MATGMAIMGFGGGAFIAAPLSVWLLGKFSTPSHVGVAETFIVLGAIYFCFMMVGAAIVLVPSPGWAPAGYTAPAQSTRPVTTKSVYVYHALKTPRFWLIWRMLCLNVHRGHRRSRPSLGHEPGNVPRAGHRNRRRRLCRADEPVQYGRPLLLASVSDYIGRKNTYFLFFVLGIILYSALPHTGKIGSVALFVLCFCIIISM
jgi:hypothetical protein